MIVLLLLGCLVLGIVGAVAFVIYGARQTSRVGQAAQAGAMQVLDGKFAGEPVVTFKQGPNTMDFDTVVTGASARGYDLTSQAAIENAWGDAHALVFTKRA